MAMVQLSRLQLYGLGSSVVFLYTVMNAFRQRSNFYAAAVYLSHSNACLMILWNQAIYQTVLFGKVLQKIFFGQLRLIEVERLQERGWFAITETLLALTIFKDDFESSFVLLFLSLLFLKVFHWLSADRVEMMEQSAQVSRLAHLRMVSLLGLLWLADILLLVFSVESILIEGPTVMIMFASEYMILIANVWTVTMKYILNCIDLRSEVPWEEKSIYGLYVELTADFFKLLTYLTFFSLILTFYGLPLNILRDVYITLRSFVLKVRDLRRYRQATRNMDTLYPDATAEEMDAMADKTCIICREDMEFRGPTAAPTDGAAAPVEPASPQRQGPNDTPKKLPCGHVFHFHCLRSWLERQQSCPTCRRTVLTQPAPRNANNAGRGVNALRGPPAAAGAPPPAPNGEDAIRQAQINLARNLGREAFGVVFPNVPFPAEALQAPPPAGAAPTPPPASGAPGSTADGRPTQDGDRPTPTPTTSISTSALLPPPGPLATSPPLTAAGDNPLARFSLPDLPPPSTGEAGLYSPPPHVVGGEYAGLAYGAYPQGLGGRFGTRSVPNLEERLRLIRRRMDGGSTSAANGSAASSTPTPTVTPETKKEQDEDKNEDEGEKREMSAREAALAAAERRAAQARGSSTAPTSGTTEGAESKRKAPAVPIVASTPTLTRPAGPRLIPLFDSMTSPTPASAYPHLTSSTDSLFPSAPTPEQLAELSTLTRGAIEERLRLLANWQMKIESLVQEMKTVLDVLPQSVASSAQSVTTTKTSEGGGQSLDKGKKATEGVHAAALDRY